MRSRAILYLALARFDDALQDFDRVIANDGSDSLAFLDRGVAQEKLGNLDGAIHDYGRSIELAPMAPTYVNRACLVHLQQTDKALADFNAALALEHGTRSPDGTCAGQLCAQVDVRESGRLQSGHRIGSEKRHRLFQTGNVHFDLRDYAAALNDYSDSLKLDPNQPVVLTTGRSRRRGWGVSRTPMTIAARAALDASVASGKMSPRGQNSHWRPLRR